VHCAAGISRVIIDLKQSTSIVCAYLMSKNKWTFLKTLGFVRAKRRIVCPNPGFERQLKNFEKQIQMNET
jgi:protein-tyrosine phosphatase